MYTDVPEYSLSDHEMVVVILSKYFPLGWSSHWKEKKSSRRRIVDYHFRRRGCGLTTTYDEVSKANIRHAGAEHFSLTPLIDQSETETLLFRLMRQNVGWTQE